VTSATVVTATSNHTVYAQWTPVSFVITLDPNGGTVASNNEISITYNTSIEAWNSNMNPSRTGYTFNGYYTATSGGTQRISNSAYVSLTSTTYSSATTLYAQWTANNYNVVFNKNTIDTSENTLISTPTGTMSNQSITFGTSANLTVNSYAITGYTFAGWRTTSDTTGTFYANQASYTMNTEGTTLYAQWTPIAYTFSTNRDTVDEYGGTLVGTPTGTDISVNQNTGSTATVPDSPYTITGYGFGGWTTIAGGSGDFYSPTDEFTMPASAVTLYAVWVPNYYNVDYNKNTISTNGNALIGTPTGTIASTGISYGYSANLTTSTYSLSGYTSGTTDRWRTTSNTSGTAYNSGASYYMNTTGRTLYQQWTANSYTVTLSRTPATNGTTSTTATMGTTMSSITVPSVTGYTFGGFFGGTGGTGTQYYNSGGTTANVWNIASNTTLYAYWTYSVTYSNNGGTGSISTTNHVYGVSSALSTGTQATRTGYTLTGWNTASNGSGTSYSLGQNITALPVAGTPTLYAVWTSNLIQLWSEGSTSYTAFSTKTVSLTSYANRKVRLVWRWDLGAYTGELADLQLDDIRVIVSGFTDETIYKFSFENSGVSHSFARSASNNTGTDYHSISWTTISGGTAEGVWNIRTGSTPTINTGTTTAPDGSYFIYTETTGGIANRNFWLRSPEIFLPATIDEVTFKLAKQGTGMTSGTTYFYVDNVGPTTGTTSTPSIESTECWDDQFLGLYISWQTRNNDTNGSGAVIFSEMGSDNPTQARVSSVNSTTGSALTPYNNLVAATYSPVDTGQSYTVYSKAQAFGEGMSSVTSATVSTSFCQPT
jgi:uncharacterized repeat protein (TIGR02543 family)